jgi:hypothetical protein
MIDNIQTDAQRVQEQLCALGIDVPEIELHVVLAGVAAGHQAGHICVPIWQGLRCLRQGRRSRRTFRHEFGHAYLYAHWDRIGAEAIKVFGDFHAPYPSRWELAAAWLSTKRPPTHVSRYAALHPLEDFAETFEWVTRHNLKPPKPPNKVLRRKLNFMKRILRE